MTSLAVLSQPHPKACTSAMERKFWLSESGESSSFEFITEREELDNLIKIKQNYEKVFISYHVAFCN